MKTVGVHNRKNIIHGIYIYRKIKTHARMRYKGSLSDIIYNDYGSFDETLKNITIHGNGLSTFRQFIKGIHPISHCCNLEDSLKEKCMYDLDNTNDNLLERCYYSSKSNYFEKYY